MTLSIGPCHFGDLKAVTQWPLEWFCLSPALPPSNLPAWVRSKGQSPCPVISSFWGSMAYGHGTLQIDAASSTCKFHVGHFSQSAKGFLFSDIDECLSSSCEGHCVNTEGGFVCECGPGMQLSADRHTCQGE